MEVRRTRRLRAAEAPSRELLHWVASPHVPRSAELSMLHVPSGHHTWLVSVQCRCLGGSWWNLSVKLLCCAGSLKLVGFEAEKDTAQARVRLSTHQRVCKEAPQESMTGLPKTLDGGHRMYLQDHSEAWFPQRPRGQPRLPCKPGTVCWGPSPICPLTWLCLLQIGDRSGELTARMNVAQLQLALGRLTSPAAAEKPDLAGYEAQGEFSELRAQISAWAAVWQGYNGDTWGEGCSALWGPAQCWPSGVGIQEVGSVQIELLSKVRRHPPGSKHLPHGAPHCPALHWA